MTFGIYSEDLQRRENYEEAQRIANTHRAEAVRLLMDSRSGRVFLRDVLHFCQVFSDPAPRNNEQLQFQEGLRRAGMYVFKALAEENPAHITTLFKEDTQA